MKIIESKDRKSMHTSLCSYTFNKNTGNMITWGRTVSENAEYSPAGPLIADIELSTICHGIEGRGPCKFCYKSNSPRGIGMTLPIFKKILSKFPKDS
jgi:hypothetical protein